jgi:hypothetical protein
MKRIIRTLGGKTHFRKDGKMAVNELRTPMRIVFIILLCFLWIFCPGEVYGKTLYEYVDKDGTAVITDIQPPGGKFKTIEVPTEKTEEKKIESGNRPNKQAEEPSSTDAPNLPLPALHPYQEPIYHGIARSAGLNYREALSQIASDKGLAGEPIATGAPEASKPVLSWETGAGKSYLVPALEIPSFILLLNGFDRIAYPNEVEGGKKVYDTNLTTFWDHVVHGPWGSDQDKIGRAHV